MPRTTAFLLALTMTLSPVAAVADEPPVAVSTITPPPGAAGGTVTLDEALRRAITWNPTVEIARQEVVRAEALARQVRAAWFPTLIGNGAFTRLDGDRELGGRVFQPANQLTANALLTVPLVAGKAWVASDRAKENVGITRALAVDARKTVAVTAARAYLTQVAQRRVLLSAQRALVNARAHEEFAKSRLAGGVGNRLDAVRASEQRATAEVSVKTQLTALARSQEALGVAVGEDKPLDALAEPVLRAPGSVEDAIGQAVRRPDIVAQRERVESARRAVRDDWVDYLPVLSALGEPFYTNPATTTFPLTGWQAQLILTIPFYDGGLRYGLADERRALEAQARARLEAALRQAKSDVRTAFDAVRLADEALAGAREAAQLSREALELAELAYRAGATSNIEVVDAERRAQETETSYAVAEDTSRQARLDLLEACGRFP
jgi:outer membrane protein TolC